MDRRIEEWREGRKYTVHITVTDQLKNQEIVCLLKLNKSLGGRMYKLFKKNRTFEWMIKLFDDRNKLLNEYITVWKDWINGGPFFRWKK